MGKTLHFIATLLMVLPSAAFADSELVFSNVGGTLAGTTVD